MAASHFRHTELFHYLRKTARHQSLVTRSAITDGVAEPNLPTQHPQKIIVIAIFHRPCHSLTENHQEINRSLTNARKPLHRGLPGTSFDTSADDHRIVLEPGNPETSLGVEMRKQIPVTIQ